jgi:ABC-2 type transport system permease protein
MSAPVLTPAPHRATAAWVFWALFMRDVTVARRELVFFLLRTSMQPLMFTVVFGFLLPKMGFVRGDYSGALLPGLLGISLALAAVQSVALPMVADFGFTKEIEDRLLAPWTTGWSRSRRSWLAWCRASSRRCSCCRWRG